MVYDIVRQDTWDVFFGFIKVSAFTYPRPESSGLFSERLARGKPGTGYLEKEGMGEEFLELLLDYV